jgi:type VI protein secretion system component Hcp
MNMRPFHTGLYSLLLGAAAVSHAAQPAGTLACTADTNNLSFNISFFEIGLASPSNSATSGAGAGKVTLNPLVVHAALSTFPSLFESAVGGEHYTSCTLTTQASSGESIEFKLNNVMIQSVNAIASSATGQSPRYAFIRADLEFESVEVRTSGGADDGGVGPTTGSGWDIRQNASS